MSRALIEVYEYASCSTCKKALKFLDQNKIDYRRIPIVDEPPTEAKIRAMLKHLGGNVRKLLNTSGQVYREMKLGEKLDQMSADEVIRLLSKNGKLIKRPFLLTPDGGATGFKEDEWKKLLK